MWSYSQSTGELFLDGVYQTTGYSGNGHGLNNPAVEDIKNVGPLPAGLYTIGKAFKHVSKGPVCMRLTPKGHDAKGRSGFLIHGDNSKGNKSASEGCIILPRSTREQISASASTNIQVKP